MLIASAKGAVRTERSGAAALILRERCKETEWTRGAELLASIQT